MSLMQVLTTRDTFQTTTTPYAFLGSPATFLPDSRDISTAGSATSATDTFSSYFPAARDHRTSLLSPNVTSGEHILASTSTPATSTTTATITTVEDLKLSNTSTVRDHKEKPTTPSTPTWNASASQEQTMNNLQHVAQQSRREKLRIPGSPQSGNHSEHAGESLESPGVGMRSSYGGNPGPQDMLSVYNNQLLAPELYSYTTSSELLNAVSGKNQGYLIAGTDGLSQVYSAPSGSFQTSGNVMSKGGGSWSANLNGQLGQFNTNSLNVTVPPTSSSGIPGALLVGSGLQPGTPYGSTTGRDLGAYFTGGAANAQDAMQLYLMNAAGFSSYPDNSTGGGAAGSMVFIPGPSNGSQQPMGSGQVSGSSPVGYNQGGRAYTGWKNGDELVFMPGSERAKSLIGSSQEGGLNEFSAAEYGLRDASLAGQHVENSQRLSLTLSSQQPALHAYDVLQQSGLDSPAGLSQDGKRPGKLGADLSHFRTDYNQGKQMHLDTTSTSAMSASFNIISSSRYLKACQQLLEEVCSVGGKGMKPGGKGSKGWAGASPMTSPTSVTNKDGAAAATTTTTTTTRGEESQDAKDGGAPTAPTSAGTASGTSGAAAATASGAGGAAASGACEGGESTSALSAEEKQELETKKSKLVAMLQEVDRRYRQYYDQMQVVISSFDAVAGVGAATPYTALALQAMSRYFRCLKDAITGQISLVCKSLGEEDISKQLTTKSPTSRLRFIDQQIRQQRAFQQLGMLNQHAWRPQRGLPERSVSILRAWLFEHFLHPYPKDADKMMLARQTGLTRSQVSNWFINARVRLWKPMVEEMYQEETREQELDMAVSRLNAAAESEADGNTTSVTTATTANAANELTTLTNNDYPKSTSAGQFGHEASASDSYLNPALRKQSLTSDSSQLYDETSQQLKKSRYTTTSGLHDSDHLLTSSMDVDLKPGADDSMQESHHQLPNGALQHHFGYDHSQLRFTNGAAAGFRYNLNPGGVSLTLGLQHSDGLAAQQQAYLQGGQGAGGAAAGFHLTPRRDSGAPVTTEHDFSSLYDNAAAAAAGLHDGMSYSSRKHMESQLLHDFVPS